MEWLNDPNAWIALVTLIALEVVLGIDNIIFLSILVGRLPEEQRQRARLIGLSLAMGMRVVLLLSIAWVMQLTEPMFSVFGKGISGRDLILILGGLFLLWKSVHEIHNSLEGPRGEEEGPSAVVAASFGAMMVQIALIDLVFSLDSVITAVGMVDEVSIMVIAVMVAVGVMMVGAKSIGEFVDRHPTVKMLALSFLVVIGIVLVAEGFGTHVPKGYVYFAMAFSVVVEMLNIRVRSRHAKAARPLKLRKAIPGEREER